MTAAAGWVLCTGMTILGWFAADSASFADALGLGTRFWLLANGISVCIGAVPVTLVPWGVTAVIAFLIARFAVASARRVPADQRTTGATIAVVTVAAYFVPVLVEHAARERLAQMVDYSSPSSQRHLVSG